MDQPALPGRGRQFFEVPNSFKESMGDFLTWLQWGIVPEGLRSEELKDKIKEIQVRYDRKE